MNNPFYNLRDKWKQWDGSEVLWVSSETFLYKALIFPTLHLSGKEESSMERLQILAIGVQSIFEPSLRSLPARLSTTVALLVLNSFNIFIIVTELTFSASYLKSDSNSAWDSALNPGAQMKMIIIIQHAENKKTHLLRDMKWVNGVLAMLFWWLTEILSTVTLYFISIEIPDDARINDELYTFSNFFDQGTKKSWL